MKTGQDVVKGGFYSSDCCLAEMELAKRGSFPRCPKCLKLTRWETVRIPVTSPTKKAA